YDNVIDVSGVVITPATEDLSFPAVNVANQLRKKVYKTKTTTAAESLTFDLGSAKAAAALVICEHDLKSGDTLTLKANSSNSWGSPPFTQAITWSSGIIVQTFSTQSYRYWRLEVTKTSAGE